MLLKCNTQYASKFGKPRSGHRTGKGQFLFQFQRRVMLKNVQIAIDLCSFHMLARIQQFMNRDLSKVHAGFRKGRGTRDQIADICWIIKKAREFHKKSASALLTMPKPLTLWITTNCGQFKRWDYQTT